MNSFRLVLCLTGLLAYVFGRHFASSKDEPVILTGPGQNPGGVSLSVEKIDPGSLISKPADAPPILKAMPEQALGAAGEHDQLHVSAAPAREQVSEQPRHLTLNAAATLR